MNSAPKIQHLLRRHVRLTNALEQGRTYGFSADALCRRIDAVDQQLAATEAASVHDLRIKCERLSAILYPVQGDIPEDCLEHIYLSRIIKDIRRLAGQH